jgi:ribosomal protein S4E
METKVAIGGGTIYIHNQDGTFTKLSDVKTIEFTDQMLIEKPSFDKSMFEETKITLKCRSHVQTLFDKKKYKPKMAKRPYPYERSK